MHKMLSNAYIKDYKANSAALRARTDITVDEVRDYFTRTRTMTALEDEMAKEDTLRIMRVVSQYTDMREEPISFVADCECDGCEKDIEKICKALRNIGLCRSRGLGAVRCVFDNNDDCAENSVKIDGHAESDNKRYRLEYTLQTSDSLMISSSSTDESMTYINGASVLGAFARIYWANGTDDDTFDRLFTMQRVRYSNLYPVNDGDVCIPAPFFLGKIKSSDENDGKIVKVFDDEYVAYTGKKPLRGKFVDRNFRKVDVDTEIVFHNSREGKGMLYTQTCITAGQCFGGYIEGYGNDIKILEELLKKNMLRFGKSKTAQYSKCELVTARITEATTENVSYRQGDVIVAAFESDCILRNELGQNAYDISTVANTLLPNCEAVRSDSALTFKTIHGYNAKWNLRRPVTTAICMGSIVTFKMPSDGSIAKYATFGESQDKGFGVVHFYRKADIIIADITESDSGIPAEQSDTVRAIIDRRERLQRLEECNLMAIEMANNDESKFSPTGVNASFIGRILLMAEEAEDIENFNERVKSIKSSAKCQEYVLVVLGQARSYGDNWREYIMAFFRTAKYIAKTKKV